MGATRGHVVGALDQRLIICFFMSLQDLLLLNNNITQANTRHICLVLYEAWSGLFLLYIHLEVQYI